MSGSPSPMTYEKNEWFTFSRGYPRERCIQAYGCENVSRIWFIILPTCRMLIPYDWWLTYRWDVVHPFPTCRILPTIVGLHACRMWFFLSLLSVFCMHVGGGLSFPYMWLWCVFVECGFSFPYMWLWVGCDILFPYWCFYIILTMKSRTHGKYLSSGQWVGKIV